MSDLSSVLSDLRAENAALDELVASLPDAQWRRATPADGWTIAHQIAHLAWTDDVAITSAKDPDAFLAVVAGAMSDPDHYVDEAAERGASQEPRALLATWRAQRAALLDVLSSMPAGVKLPWFGPAMSPTSMGTARLMETWAHGQDIADALGVTRPATKRLRNIAHIGVRTRDFAFAIRGLTPPDEPFRVELAAPAGELWAWGPEGAAQSVAGAALDFCLLVTQRRHRDDLRVTAIGADAEAWLGIAQAFAGAPGPGRGRSA